MSDSVNPQEKGLSLWDTRMTLPHDVQGLLPDSFRAHYERTNSQHTGEGLGGSTFSPEVGNVFEVVARRPDIAEHVRERTDDRKALLRRGATEDAFVPAIRSSSADSPVEALYYLVEGVEGRLGVIRLSELPRDANVLVRREKGTGKQHTPGYAPVSITYIGGSAEQMPKTNFASIVVGRDYDREGNVVSNNAVWTVHPGPPIRSGRYQEYPWTKDLLGPDEIPPGGKQHAKIMTVGEAMEKFGLTRDDYIKIVPGSMDEMTKRYDIT